MKVRDLNESVNRMKYLMEYKEGSLMSEEIEEGRKNIFVLVGPPSVGKSTWIKNKFTDLEGQPYVINRDDLVEAVATQYGWTYDDMFALPAPEEEIGTVDEKYGEIIPAPSFMTWPGAPKSVFKDVLDRNGEVKELFDARVSGAIPSNQDIVVDMTNMSAGARKGALRSIEGSEGDYNKIAVVFNFKGGEETIKKIAAKRAAEAEAEGKSKTIPPHVFDGMFKNFQEVDPSEGFDAVENENTIKCFSCRIGR